MNSLAVHPLCYNRKGRTLPCSVADNVLRLTLSTGRPPFDRGWVAFSEGATDNTAVVQAVIDIWLSEDSGGTRGYSSSIVPMRYRRRSDGRPGVIHRSSAVRFTRRATAFLLSKTKLRSRPMAAFAPYFQQRPGPLLQRIQYPTARATSLWASIRIAQTR
jgi:hypothetical protein